MSSTVDERVVAMKFNNSQFEQGIKTTLGSLSALKSNLNMQGASKGLESINSAARNVDLSKIASSVEGLASKFSAMSIVGITALTNLANKAVNAGINLAKSLTITPIMSGKSEYETKLGSIQTILANTKAAGTTLPQVSKALNELNTYSDQTIYNFGEMARNIGTFTAAGVDLKTSVTSIKGIANLAALSGSNAEQASGAMYQLSQAISEGRMSLESWNSVQNAGMGGAVFQRSLVQTAVAMGKLPASAVKLVGPMKNVTVAGQSFRQSITAKPGKNSWLDTKILTTALGTFTGDMKAADLAAQGFKKSQIKDILDTALAAKRAATVVKTGTQLVGVLQESAQSGWAATWELVAGDFEQAPKMWTNVNNIIGGMINASADARNKIVADWSKGVNGISGRVALIDTVTYAFKALMALIKPIKDAFRSIFPATTGKQLFAMTIAIRDFAARLQMGAATADKVKRTFAGVFAVLKIGWDIVKGITRYFFSLFSIVGTGSGGILSLTAAAGDFLVKIAGWLNKSGAIKKFFDGMIKAKENILQPIVNVVAKIADAFGNLFSGNFGGFLDGILSGFSNIGNVVNGYAQNIGNMFGKISNVAAFISGYLASLNFPAPIVDTFGYIAKMFDNMRKNFNLDFIVNIIDIISKKFQDLRNNVTSGNPFEAIIASIQSVIDKFKAMRDNFSTDSLPKFDLARFKTASVDMSGMSTAGSTLSRVWDGLSNALSNIGASFGPIIDRIGAFFDVISAKVLEYIKGMTFQDGVALLNTGFFIAMYIMLTKFIKSMKGVFDSASKMINNLGAVFKELGKSLKTMQQDVKANIILKIAIAVGILVGAVYVLSKIPKEELIKAMAALSIMFVELGIMLVAFDKINTDNKGIVKTSAGLILLAIAVKILAGAIKELSGISWTDLAKGLIGVGGLLVALTLFSKFASAEKGGLSSGVGLVMLAIAIKLLVGSISDLGTMDTGVLIKGIVALGVMLVLLAGVVKMFNNTKGIIQASVGMLILAGALLALSYAIKGYAKIDPEIFATGLARIAKALALIGIAMWLMPTNVKAIAGSLLVISAALLVLSGVLKIIGAMDDESIVKGLKGLGGSVAIITIALLALSRIRNDTLFEIALALIVVAKALVIFAAVLVILSKIPAKELGIALAGLAGIFAIIVAAMWALTPVVATLKAFAIGLLILGGAMLVAGAGMMLFAGALAILAVSGAVGFAVLAAGVIAFINMIPLIAQQIGLGIIAIAKVLSDAGPVWFKAMTVVLKAMLKSFIAVIPLAVVALTVLILSLLDAIIRISPKLVEAGWTIVLAILKGLSDHIQDLTVLGIKIVTAFVRGLIDGRAELIKAAIDLVVSLINGITSKLSDIITAASKFVVAFIQGLVNNLPSIIKAGSDFIIAFLVGLAVNLPGILKAGTDVIVAFLNGLIASIPRLVTAGVGVLVALINSFASPENLQRFMDAGWNLISNFITGFIKRIPEMVGFAFDIFTKFIEGLSNPEKLKNLANKGTDLIVNFLTAFTQPDNIKKLSDAGIAAVTNIATGISDGSAKLFDALFDIVVKSLHDLAATIRKDSGELADATIDVGSSIIEGFVKGMTVGPRIIGTAGKNLAGDLIDAVTGKDGIDAHSPSRKFFGIGGDVVDGLANGINENANLIKTSATNMGHSAIDAMRKSISGMDSLVPNDMEINPTITPVLDLTNVQKDALGIGSLLSTDPIAVGATYSNAQTASAGYNANPVGPLQTRTDMQALTAAIAAVPAVAKETTVPRPVEFHIGKVEDGDSLLRRARATNKMLSLAEGGDSSQIVGLGI